MTILQGYLYSDVAQAGTVTIAYPAGFSPDSFDKAGAKACLLSVNSSMPDGSYSLAWGGSSVVVTNLSGVWKGGVSVFISVPDVANGQGEIVRATTDLTGGSTLSGPTSTLKLPAGETDLSSGVGGGALPEGTTLLSYPYYSIQVACPTNATTTANGVDAGIGDVLGKVNFTVNTSGATALLSIQDGAAGTVYVLNPVGGFTATGAQNIDLGYTSTVGAWRVICGAGLNAVASLL